MQIKNHLENRDALVTEQERGQDFFTGVRHFICLQSLDRRIW